MHQLLCVSMGVNLVGWAAASYIQGGFFNCSHPKISKYKKKPKYTNCSHGNSSEMSKYGKSQNIVTVPHC